MQTLNGNTEPALSGSVVVSIGADVGSLPRGRFSWDVLNASSHRDPEDPSSRTLVDPPKDPSLASRQNLILEQACINSKFVAAEFWQVKGASNPPPKRRFFSSVLATHQRHGSKGLLRSFTYEAPASWRSPRVSLSRSAAASRDNSEHLAERGIPDSSAHSDPIVRNQLRALNFRHGHSMLDQNHAAGRPPPLDEASNDFFGVGGGIFLVAGGQYVKRSFLESSLCSDSEYAKRNVNVVDLLNTLNTLNGAAKVIQGEGLEGMAWERGEHETQILEHFIQNPELQMQQRYEVAAALFATLAALAVPVRNASKRIVGVLMLYLPHRAESPTAYLHLDSNRNLTLFTARIADMLAVDLEWEKSVGALRRAEAELTAEDKKRAQELWHKVRVMVRVGQLKKEGAKGAGEGGGSVELPSSQHTSDTDPSPSAGRGLREWLGAYGEKWKGNRANKPPPRATWTAGAWTLVGALLGMLLPSALHTALVRHTHSPSLFLMVGSYGALA
eukprot:CAMPEP_0181345298 /NCGR_PEP_ID=MMETSP1101-20121128/32673_1 /TAXON_ID=46948 /ORGANISM="Rhodomonas abbreviata, Strain Caron Lab Isolate" /LENGTH=500 /DNA_ID=CAMNT_0023457241 /DNA_START=13 /DNA_END=1511 /DNA_ORIENTATION=+